ncbi:MAG TPA: PAS domain-containing protein [Rhizomicrobium sp.]|jgi:hypothetical protein
MQSAMFPPRGGIDFDWALTARLPTAIAGRDYWLSKRTGEGIPSRGDLKPTEMRTFLTHVGLIENKPASLGKRHYFIRQAGTRWEDVFGKMTGRFIDEFLPPEIETRWQSVFDQIWDAARPCVVRSSILFQKKSWLAAEMFIAPLGDAGSDVSMLFMCFSVESVSNDIDAPAWVRSGAGR